MKVVFALRSDAKTKPGGDTGKIDKYISEFEKRGIRSEVVTSPAALRQTQADLIHIINLDLPLENSRYAKIARQRSIPLALSTIHHPLVGQRAFYALGEDNFNQMTRRIGLPPERSTWLRENVRLAKLHPGSIISEQAENWIADGVKKQARLLQFVDLVLPMSSAEARGIRDEVGVGPGLVREVPNGFTFKPINSRSRTARTGLLCVGRIEPRKNQIALIRAVASLGYDLTFVGALNRKHKSFCRTFLKLVGTYPNVHYRSRLPQEELGQLYDNCRVHVSASWMEVVSQVDLEAAARGAAVIASRNNYAAEYFDRGYQLFDPADAVVRAEELRSLVDSEYMQPKRLFVNSSFNLTWAEVVDRLWSAYEAVL